MRTRVAAIVAAVGILGSVVGGASASGPSDMLIGGYKYRAFNDSPRQVSISAHETGSVKGSWQSGDDKGVRDVPDRRWSGSVGGWARHRGH